MSALDRRSGRYPYPPRRPRLLFLEGPLELHEWERTVVVVGDCASGGTVSYEILPQYIYPYGECPECLAEMCLAAAELLQDDTLGLHEAKAMELLIACVIRDRMKHSTNLGYCSDNSDAIEDGFVMHHEVTGITYDGVTP